MITNKINWISLAALLILVTSLPAYAILETQRMEKAQHQLRDRYVMDGVDLYLQNCASCHGPSGEGIGMMPALNRQALAEAQTDRLFETISRAVHGSAMASWHVEEGGILNDYQTNELVALIQHADWAVVSQVAAVRGVKAAPQPVIETGQSYLDTEDMEDPHQCTDCHEEPALHAELFGINCARCHNTQAWKPALLTRHDFLIDHGGEGNQNCQTCHADSYARYDCYACHNEHQAQEMETAHLAENITDLANCASCHPTGAAGEADQLRKAAPDQGTGKSDSGDTLTSSGLNIEIPNSENGESRNEVTV